MEKEGHHGGHERDAEVKALTLKSVHVDWAALRLADVVGALGSYLVQIRPSCVALVSGQDLEVQSPSLVGLPKFSSVR